MSGNQEMGCVKYDAVIALLFALEPDPLQELLSFLIEIAKKPRYHEVLHLRFGGDDRETTISFASESRDWEEDGEMSGGETRKWQRQGMLWKSTDSDS